MKKSAFSLLTVLALGSVFLPGAAWAAESIPDKLAGEASDAVDSISRGVSGGLDKAVDFLDDSAVTTKVKSALLAQGKIKSTNISVTTKNGVVTLSGEARSMSERGLIIDTAAHVDGVRSVRTQDLRIAPSTSQSADEYVSDAAITAAVKGRLGMASPGYLTDIKVETHDGIVSLYGAVENSQEYIEAQRAAGEADGVRGVQNYLVVRKK